MSNEHIEDRIDVTGLKDGRSLDQVGEPANPTPIPITEALPLVEPAPDNVPSGDGGSTDSDGNDSDGN